MSKLVSITRMAVLSNSSLLRTCIKNFSSSTIASLYLRPHLPTTRTCIVPLFLIQCRYAGHSKWQNIRHVKASTDAQKGATSAKFAMLIKKEACARGTDPKLNKDLAKLIELAIKAGVTRETINRNIDRAKNIQFKSFTIEILGPGGCIILASIDSESMSKARNDARIIVKEIFLRSKIKCAIMKEGTGIVAFETKGAIMISKRDKDGQIVTLEKAEEIGIEAEAEEVIGEETEQLDNGTSDNGTVEEVEQSWTLRTTPADLYSVKSYVEKNFPTITILDCDTEYIPRYQIDLSDADLDKAATFISELESNEDISKVTSNVK